MNLIDELIKKFEELTINLTDKLKATTYNISKNLLKYKNYERLGYVVEKCFKHITYEKCKIKGHIIRFCLGIK